MGHDQQVALADLLHLAYRQAGEGRRVEGADVDLALADEVVGAAAVEGLVRVRHEEMFGAAAGRAGQIRASFEDAVQTLAVVGGDVLDVARVLVAPFDLEGAHAGVHQGAEVGALVVVLHRQQVLLEGHHAALVVFQGVGQAAGLGAVAPIGAAAGLGVGDVALAGEGHTQGAVDEELDGRVGFVGDGADLLEVQFAGQHQLGEAGLVEEFGALQGTDVGLGAGVQLDGRDVQVEDPHVLHDQRVDAGVVEFVDQLACRLQLVVVEDGVEGDEHPHMEAVGELHQPGDFRHFVAGVVAGAEARAADVHGIGAMQDGLAGDIDVAGGAEQF
ncbi:hypothetical protein D9M71_83790 [compost metagenome]